MAYAPAPFSGVVSPENLLRYLQGELERIGNESAAAQAAFVRFYKDEPPKPRDWMIAATDATTWDPGAGAGVYVYYSGTWNKAA